MDDWLIPTTSIKNLYLTGQDITTLGVTGDMSVSGDIRATGVYIVNEANTEVYATMNTTSVAVGVAAQFNDTVNFNKTAVFKKHQITSGTNVDFSAGNKVHISLPAGDQTIFINGHPKGACNLMLIIDRSSGTGGELTVTSTGKTIKWANGGMKPNLSDGASGVTDIVAFYYDGVSTYYGMMSVNFR